MSVNIPYKNGFHFTKDWVICVRDGKYIYGFHVTPKTMSDDLKKQIKDDIFKRTEELCGNRSGNSFITTQINYDG